MIESLKPIYWLSRVLTIGIGDVKAGREAVTRSNHILMKVKSIDKVEYLTTTFFDPSPRRLRREEPPLSERRIPLVYTCENCGQEIGIDNTDLEKHFNSQFSNLHEEDKQAFQRFINDEAISTNSFLDFYCPQCAQATRTLFIGGIWGWGEFGFRIYSVLVLKCDRI